MSSSSTSKSSLLDQLEDPKGNPTPQGDQVPAQSKKLIVTAGVFVLSLAVLGYVLFSTFQSFSNDPRRAAGYTRVMDSETGEYIEQFPFTGERLVFPAVNPKTGKKTLFPVELCYWTKDGRAKIDPTPVILNQWLGKPGQTICPDCGRPVSKGNRMPADSLMQAAWEASQKK